MCVFYCKSNWLYTERARSFPSQIFPKNLPRRSKIHYFCGKFRFAFPKKVIVFCFFSSSPVNVPLGKCSTVGHGRSGARFPLGPSRPLASYCPRLPSFCAIIVSVLFLAPLRDVLLAAPACYRTHCACFLSLCALFWAASLGRGFG